MTLPSTALEELERRREKARAMGGPAKLAKRKAAGQLNAEERLALLVDEGTFRESGLLGESGVFESDRGKTPRDGKVVGFGKVGGRDCGVVINDFTVKGSSTSATNSKKMGHVRRTAIECGMPFIHVGESTGARMPDTMGSKGMGSLLGNDPHQFRRTRDNPWAAAALDTAFGSSAWMCCCADFAVMRKGSIMAVSSPKLVSIAIGEKVDLEALGGWRLHAETTGLIDRVVDTDAEAMDAIKRFLSYMPSHNGELPPVAEVPPGSGEGQDRILGLLPEKRTQVYDIRKILEVIVDHGSMFELKPRFGKSAVVALARLGGKVVGLIANNPAASGGALTVDAIRKILDFTVMCDSFNIPMVRFMDTPGFVVGLEAERRGAPGFIMNFMNATSLVSVPTITVLVRKAYGRAYVAMGGGRNNDELIAWPTAEISFMDPAASTQIVHGVSPGQPGWDEAFAHISQDSEVWDMASMYAVQNVVQPQETRDHLIGMLDVYRRRRTGGIGQHLMRTWPTSF
jgi:acetyl-CoA carboxylase carboxyltransferase component